MIEPSKPMLMTPLRSVTVSPSTGVGAPLNTDRRIDMNDDAGSEILDGIRAAGRRVLPMHEYLAAHNPSGLAGYNAFLMSSIYDQDALEPMYKEIVLAVVCVAAGSAVPVIAAHCRKALEFGASREQVLQAIEMTAAVFATRTMGAGVSALVDADPDGVP